MQPAARRHAGGKLNCEPRSQLLNLDQKARAALVRARQTRSGQTRRTNRTKQTGWVHTGLAEGAKQPKCHDTSICETSFGRCCLASGPRLMLDSFAASIARSTDGLYCIQFWRRVVLERLWL